MRLFFITLYNKWLDKKGVNIMVENAPLDIKISKLKKLNKLYKKYWQKDYNVL